MCVSFSSCLLLLSVLQFPVLSGGNKIFVCYFTPTRYFSVDSVPAETCTHLIYAFGTIANETIVLSSSDRRTIKSLVRLKEKNQGLNVLLSLQKDFSSVVGASITTMTKFSYAAITVLRDIGVDGVDFDWEFPRSKDKNNYSTFLKVFRNINEKESKASAQKVLLVSLALANNAYVLQKGYDVSSINQNVDIFTVMAYDFHVFNSRIDNRTGFNSPLFPVKRESKYLSTSGLVSHCLKMGFEPSKLLLGIPTYGRSYRLADSKKNGLHALALSKGDPGPYRHLRGIYAFPDVCVAVQQGATVKVDSQSHGKYLYKETAWVSFDDVGTVTEKTQWALSQGLGGVGIWSVELDDLEGVCGKTKLPLMTAIKNELNN